MPTLAANLSLLFREVPFPERFAAAAACGFRYVEFQFPYAYDAGLLARSAREAGVEVVLHNLPAGNHRAGELGIACLPGRQAEFHAALEQGIAYAQVLGCARLNCLAGVAPAGVARSEMFLTLVENIRQAARRMADEGLTLLLEPLNTRTMPGFFLDRSDAVLEVLAAAGAPNVRLQYDVFHMQIMEGDLACRLERLLPRIGHIQIADVPGRNEPGTGEVNFSFLLAHIDRLGYRGFTGCEYNPTSDTAASLAWARPYL